MKHRATSTIIFVAQGMKYLIYLGLFIVIGTSSCKKSTIEVPVDHSSKYIPLDLGYTWTYTMDSIVYSGFEDQLPDTFAYYIKNTVADSFTNGAGYTEYRIERYFKTDSTDWQFVRNYTEYRTQWEYMRKDFDLREILHSLPILRDKTWDGNIYNTRNEAEFFYEYTHVPDTILSIPYDSVTTIYQDENQNLITSYFAIEKYAANTGLVYREQERFDNFGTKAQKGFKYTLQLISFEE